MALDLPILPRGVAIAGKDGKPTIEFQKWWQEFKRAIEAQEARQDAVIADIQAVQAQLVAQLAAITAVTTANAISASWVNPANPLSATDAGANATITVANFTRFYDDGTSVSITGAAITGLSYSTVYSVYYDDTTRADATPTFVATTFAGTARHNFEPGRHFLGTVTTPASGGSPVGGDPYIPPGGGGTEVP